MVIKFIDALLNRMTDTHSLHICTKDTPTHSKCVCAMFVLSQSFSFYLSTTETGNRRKCVLRADNAYCAVCLPNVSTANDECTMHTQSIVLTVCTTCSLNGQYRLCGKGRVRSVHRTNLAFKH